MFKYVHHVHYLVSDLDGIIAFMEKNFGMRPEAEETYELSEAHASKESIKEAHYRVGPTLIEFTEPLDPESKYGRRLARHGPYVIHVAWGVDDLEALSEELAASGIKHRKHDSPRGYHTVNIDLDEALGTHFQLANG